MRQGGRLSQSNASLYWDFLSSLGLDNKVSCWDHQHLLKACPSPVNDRLQTCYIGMMIRRLPFQQLRLNICCLGCRVLTVREFVQLAWHAAGYPHMQQRLQPLLGLTQGRWDAACQHAKAAVQVGRLW